ncbi:MAG: diguanylate cyclase [Proteobacteria bacterium]|nr:diguanylate cyclase [Pseudomonadota bacterium]
MPKNRLTILIIDHHPEDQEMYQHLLKQDKEHKYQILEADSGNEGLDILWTTSVDCILLTTKLPDMTGVDVLKAITENIELEQVPVIFLSRQGDEMLAVEAMKSGATDYLIKNSLTWELLVRAILYSLKKNEAEKVLKDNYSFLSTFLNTIPNPIFYKDIHGKYIDCNASFESFMGISKNELIGKSVHDIMPEQVAEEYYQIDCQLIKTPGVVTIETELMNKAGVTYDIILNQATYTDMKGEVKGFLGSITDITERKTMENKLKKTAQALDKNVKVLKKANLQIIEQQIAVIEEERLKVLLQMAGATAHEINQPLSVLLWHTELMVMHKDNPEKIMRHVERVESAGQRIAEIVKKIQTIRHYEVKPYPGNSKIINIDQSLSILCVEENDDDFARIHETFLSIGAIHPLRAKNPDDAFHILEDADMDVILLDLFDKPEIGFDFLDAIARMGIETPIVVVTNQKDEMIASQIIQKGAYDYLPKAQLNKQSLFRVISNTMEKYRLKKEIRQTTEKLSEMSTRDELTGLYNRRYLMEVLERKTASAERYNKKLALCLMDIESLEVVNETYGLRAGDKVLMEVAKILQRISRKCDIPCRLGGKIFAIVIADTSIRNARNVCDRFRKKIEKHVISYKDNEIRIRLSIGLASYSLTSDSSWKDLIQKAEHSLHSGKTEARTNLRVV